MTDDTRDRKGQAPRRSRTTRRRTADRRSVRDTAPPDAADDTELGRARVRIAQLEAELAAAQRTNQVSRSEDEYVMSAPIEPAYAEGSTGASAPGELDRLEASCSRSPELERINEMKVEFISIATHELRTPLTSIVGYLDLLAEGSFGDVPKAMERPMASLRRNAHRLKRVVDEMLDVSRIDAGRVTLYRTPCDIGGIVRDVVAELEPHAASKRLALNATVDEPPEIYADIKRIRQATSKLIANAIRHTPEGGAITAIVDTVPPGRMNGTWARLRVKGTGITIPNHLRNHIFEPFGAVHTAKHHTSSGPDSAGLGLYIARGLIDLHGGVISVDSKEGAYTEFTVLLPRSEPSAG